MGGGGEVEYEYYLLDAPKEAIDDIQFDIQSIYALSSFCDFIIKAHDYANDIYRLIECSAYQAVYSSSEAEIIFDIRGFKCSKKDKLVYFLQGDYNYSHRYETSTILSGDFKNKLSQLNKIMPDILLEEMINYILYYFKPITKEEYESIIGQPIND